MEAPSLWIAAGLVLLAALGVVCGLLLRSLRQARRAEETAREDNRRLTGLLDSVHEAFMSLDREWRFVYVNRYFEPYWRRPVEELIGQSIWDAYPELLGTEFETGFRKAMTEGETVQFEAQGVTTGRWYRVSAYPSAVGLTVFGNDLTESRRSEAELRQARTEAEAANHIKDQFLATLSHELRTPLNAILGWVQILRSGALDPEGTARGLEVIERNSRVQAQLIDDLLDVSRIISGKLRLALQPMNPAEIVEAALATVLPAAKARGIAIERRFDSVDLVLADPDRLQQVIWNLLSNAVKFTPSGGTVEVLLRTVDGQVEIQVRDTGQGIAPDLLPHVFELFRQGDGSSTRRQAGLGLGLSIARQLVELHGGSVRAESPGEGQGTTVTVSLPVAAPTAEETAPAAGESPSADPSLPLAGLRVLAVDDDRDTLEVVAELLTLRGAEVTPAASAAEALEALERFEPDVLVSDIGMPERDGYDLIRDIRERGRGPADLPAVAVTAFAAPEDRRKALAAGFQVHLAKPVDPGELTAVVARLGHRL